MGHDHDLGKTKNLSASWVPQDTRAFEYPKRHGIQDLRPEAWSSWNVDIDFLLGRDGRNKKKTREIKEETK